MTFAVRLREEADLDLTEAVAALGVSRKTPSAILNGRAGVSQEMALRLSIAFDTTPESWLSQQAQYDLWNARQEGKAKPYQVRQVLQAIDRLEVQYD